MKQIITLVIIFLVLVGGYLTIREFSEPKEYQAPTNLSFASWQIDNFTKVVLEKDNVIKLEKQEDSSWKVNDFNASSEKVGTLFASFANAKVVSQVSTNPDNHARFNVDSTGTKVIVKFVDAHEEALIIGKSAGGNSVYLRIPETDGVYVLDGVATSLFNTQLDLWRDRALTSLTAGEVSNIQFSNDSNTYTVAMTDDYSTSSLERAGYALVDLDIKKSFEWLSKVVGQMAVEFPTIEETENISDSKQIATITLNIKETEEEGPSVEILKVYTSEQDNFYLVIREQDFAGFLVSTSVFDNIFIEYKDLISELSS